MNYILLFFLLNFVLTNKEHQPDITQKHFYSDLKLNINYPSDTLLNNSNKQNKGEYNKMLWKSENLHFPFNPVENAVFFKYKDRVNNRIELYSNIIEKGKLSPRAIFPPKTLTKLESQEVLNIINDTLNYRYWHLDESTSYYLDAYCGIIFLDKYYSIVGYVTIGHDYLYFVPPPSNKMIKFDQSPKLDSLILKIERRE